MQPARAAWLDVLSLRAVDHRSDAISDGARCSFGAQQGHRQRWQGSDTYNECSLSIFGGFPSPSSFTDGPNRSEMFLLKLLA